MLHVLRTGTVCKEEEVVCLSFESGNGLSNSVLQIRMTYWYAAIVKKCNIALYIYIYMCVYIYIHARTRTHIYINVKMFSTWKFEVEC